MAIMVASFRESVDDLAQRGLARRLVPANLAPRRHGFPRSGLRIACARAAGSGARRIPAHRPAHARSGASFGGLARTRFAGGAEKSLPLLGPALAPDGAPPAWVSEAVCGSVWLPARKRRSISPSAESNAHCRGRCLARLRAPARRHCHRPRRLRAPDRDNRVNDAALWLKPGVGTAQIESALRALPGGELPDMAGPGEIRKCRCGFSTAVRSHLCARSGGRHRRPVRPLVQPWRNRACAQRESACCGISA